jgi:hypothetical protein
MAKSALELLKDYRAIVEGNSLRITKKPLVKKKAKKLSDRCISCGNQFDNRGCISTAKGPLCPSCAE